MYGDSLASLPCPLTLNRSDSADVISNRYNLQYNRNCLLAAWRNLNDSQTRSATLCTQHLEARAQAAAHDSNTTAETTLNHILQSEEAHATFQKLRKHAKGVVHSPLMRVDIPVPSPNGNPSAQTHSCSNPTELFSAILNQNIQHFSQASDNPGAAGRLSDILPPFQSDHNTTAILQGALDNTQIDPLSDVSLFL